MMPRWPWKALAARTGCWTILLCAAWVTVVLYTLSRSSGSASREEKLQLPTVDKNVATIMNGWSGYAVHPDDDAYDPHCHCRKLNTGGHLADNDQSLCSASATSRGPGQRVISYCLYGQAHRYLNGIVLNLEGMKRHYSGYTMRIYHNFGPEQNPTDLQTLYVATIMNGWSGYAVHPDDDAYDPHCHCRKLNTGGHLADNDQSLCSASATSRGPGQRVISYCLYGQAHRYLNGIVLNLEGMKRHYSGYTMRIYHNFGPEQNPTDLQTLCDVYCNNPEVDICDSHDIGTLGDISSSFGMVWRFAPMMDPTVDEWHSRDLDSRIMDREVAAVKDWKLNSAATFHVMRDNPYHGVPMLGGMFGMRLPVDKSQREAHLRSMGEVMEAMLEATKDTWVKTLDQEMLRTHLWPRILDSGSLVSHDSYFCTKFGFGRAGVDVRPFPVQRESTMNFKKGVANNFVGANGGALTKHCPKQCRPEDHQDWLLC